MLYDSGQFVHRGIGYITAVTPSFCVPGFTSTRLLCLFILVISGAFLAKIGDFTVFNSFVGELQPNIVAVVWYFDL